MHIIIEIVENVQNVCLEFQINSQYVNLKAVRLWSQQYIIWVTLCPFITLSIYSSSGLKSNVKKIDGQNIDNMWSHAFVATIAYRSTQHSIHYLFIHKILIKNKSFTTTKSKKFCAFNFWHKVFETIISKWQQWQRGHARYHPSHYLNTPQIFLYLEK